MTGMHPRTVYPCEMACTCRSRCTCFDTRGVGGSSTRPHDYGRRAQSGCRGAHAVIKNLASVHHVALGVYICARCNAITHPCMHVFLDQALGRTADYGRSSDQTSTYSYMQRMVCKQKLSVHYHVTMQCSTGGCSLDIVSFHTSIVYPARMHTLACVCAAITNNHTSWKARTSASVFGKLNIGSCNAVMRLRNASSICSPCSKARLMSLPSTPNCAKWSGTHMAEGGAHPHMCACACPL